MKATNGREAIQLSQELKPDAIVMDITMPVMNGLQATTQILKTSPTCKVLILTTHENGTLSQPIKDSGASGLLTKTRAVEELTPALKAIIGGETYFR